MVGAPVKPTGPPTPPPQKPRPTAPQREGSAKRGGKPGPIIRAVISLVIVWHFTAIFLAAMSVPGPTSPLVYNIAQNRPMAWYLDALYLNQGHSFFAPDVGPGHELRYTLFDQSNRELGKGTLPDKKEHWPRLWYHRHLMLADQVEMGSDDPQANEQAKRMILEGYARQLLRKNKEAQSVRVQLYNHWPLPTGYAYPNRARGYQMLQQDIAREAPNRHVDGEGYEVIGEAVQRRSDLPPEPVEPAEQAPPATPDAPNAWNPPNANPNGNWQTERPNVAGRWGRGAR